MSGLPVPCRLSGMRVHEVPVSAEVRQKDSLPLHLSANSLHGETTA